MLRGMNKVTLTSSCHLELGSQGHIPGPAGTNRLQCKSRVWESRNQRSGSASAPALWCDLRQVLPSLGLSFLNLPPVIPNRLPNSNGQDPSEKDNVTSTVGAWCFLIMGDR